MEEEMVKLYWLVRKDGKELPITIDEDAKEGFMELMEWDEEKWKRHTKLIKEIRLAKI